jgi:hypothetical protein
VGSAPYRDPAPAEGSVSKRPRVFGGDDRQHRPHARFQRGNRYSGRVASNAFDNPLALDWLLERQPAIEVTLAKRHLTHGTLVLYDVSSSYMEGCRCPLAERGYSRDGRKGTLLRTTSQRGRSKSNLWTIRRSRCTRRRGIKGRRGTRSRRVTASLTLTLRGKTSLNGSFSGAMAMEGPVLARHVP